MLNSLYEKDEQSRIEKTIFLADYNMYRKANGLNTVSQKFVGKRLQDHRIFTGGGGRMYYMGIRQLSVDERLERGLPVSDDEQTNDIIAKQHEELKASNEFEKIANRKTNK